MSVNTNDDQLQAEPLAEVTPTYNIHLEPPIGTSFWSVQDIELFEGKKIDSATVDWSCRCYIFTTNQSPDSPDFVKSGGAFYIIFEHRGQLDMGSRTLKLRMHADSAIPVTHVPNRSTKNGDDWTATIDYEQQMQMFKNKGHEAFTHTAKYNDTFPLYDVNQSGGVVDGAAEARFDSAPYGRTRPDRPVELRGLSVFRQHQPDQWPLKFKFEATFGDKKARASSALEKNFTQEQ
ncbi:hypothetical protein AB1N83_014002 [Pleurotus pulmonarius]